MNDAINRKDTIGAILSIEHIAELRDGDAVIRVSAVNYVLRNLPSEDVQAVKRGHWIHDGLDIPHGVDWMHCSECGKRDKYCPAAMTNYCPNCGAKMDGEKND